MAIVCYCSLFHSNCGEILFVFPPFIYLLLIVISFLDYIINLYQPQLAVSTDLMAFRSKPAAVERLRFKMLVVFGLWVFQVHRHCEECLNDAVPVGMQLDSIISNSLLNHFTKLNGGEDITRATQWLSG